MECGDRSRPWSLRHSNGWTGSITGGCSSLSATFRRPKPRHATMPCWMSQPWQRDSNEMASGKPGAVHNFFPKELSGWTCAGFWGPIPTTTMACGRISRWAKTRRLVALFRLWLYHGCAAPRRTSLPVCPDVVPGRYRVRRQAGDSRPRRHGECRRAHARQGRGALARAGPRPSLTALARAG